MIKEDYEKYILDVPDFPKQGVIFKDMTPLLEKKFDHLISDFKKAVKDKSIDAIVGIESRGFILGSALANSLDIGFIPIRKKGKLPPPFLQESYSLEYGEDIIEMKENSQTKKVILIDDVLATGGTLKAALSLCEKNNYYVEQIFMLINLTFLNDFKDERLFSILDY